MPCEYQYQGGCYNVCDESCPNYDPCDHCEANNSIFGAQPADCEACQKNRAKK